MEVMATEMEMVMATEMVTETEMVMAVDEEVVLLV